MFFQSSQHPERQHRVRHPLCDDQIFQRLSTPFVADKHERRSRGDCHDKLPQGNIKIQRRKLQDTSIRTEFEPADL